MGILGKLTGYRSYDFSEVEKFLRKWPSLDDEPGQYDFVGSMHLFLAILENLTSKSLEADVDSYRESLAEDNAQLLSPQQRRFLEELLKADEWIAATASGQTTKPSERDAT
jgi:hypothetical protein